jgi:hypothetical protein
MNWIVVVRQEGSAGQSVGDLTAFGPMEEEAAESLMSEISWGVDDEARKPYVISWVAAVPCYESAEGFDKVLTEESQPE